MSKVAVLRTSPNTVVEDYGRLMRSVERIAHALLEKKNLANEQVLRLLKEEQTAVRRAARPPNINRTYRG
jgi:hypothetical protein